MKPFRADLHIHTVLSPCGDLEMSPVNIVQQARALNLDIIGITDHNSTRHCALIRRLAREEGITVLQGAEVTTREEVHCLTFFDNDESLEAFQHFLDEKITRVQNDTSRFGYQVVVDEDENILDEVPYLLIAALSAGIDEVQARVHALGGFFIPAHADRPAYSLISQLGFIPPSLSMNAIEIHRDSNCEDFRMKHHIAPELAILKSSDAHYIGDIGRTTTTFMLAEPHFNEIRMAFEGKNGRKVIAA
jgi:3',5'-nucleoside bisphosphate phosphatase